MAMRYIVRQENPDEIALQVLGISAAMRETALTERTKVQGGDLPLADFLAFCTLLRQRRDEMTALRAKVVQAGIGPAAIKSLQRQVDDGSWADPAADIQALVDGVGTFLGRVETNFPADANGWLRYYKFAGNGDASLDQRHLLDPADATQLDAIEGWLDTLIAVWE